MKHAIPPKSYLVRNRYSYCFRMKVPKDLRQLIKKTELRYSLKTGYLGHARNQAQLLAGLLHKLFIFLRENCNGMELDPSYVDDIIENFKAIALDNYMSNQLAEAETTADIVTVFGDLLSRIAATKIGQQAGTSLWVSNALDNVLKGMGYENEDDIGSAQYMELNRTLMRITLERLVEEKDRLKAEYPELEFDRLFGQQLDSVIRQTEVGTSGPSSSHEPKGKLISEEIPSFISEHKVNWAEKHENTMWMSLNLFVKCIGDVPIQEVTRAKVAEYKSMLQQLPANMNKSPKYREKTIHEILEMDIPKTLSVTSINKYIERVGQLFDFVIRHGRYVGPNPATKMQIPTAKHEKEKRAAFTVKEVEALLRSKQYREDSFKKSYMFWTPIIALFHGMRQDEIAGLSLKNIRQADEGVWVFDLTDRKLKTEAANRMVPIHPFLLKNLNLKQYVQQLRREGQSQLFPELKKGRDGYGKNVSRWFNERYKKQCGIVSPDGRMRDFHSFRATFITYLRHKKAHDRMLKEVVGHSVNEGVTDDYTEIYPPKQLLEEIIEKVEFHKVLDLTHLKDSKWVAR